MSDNKKHFLSFMLMFFFSIIYMLPIIQTNNIFHFTDQDTAFHLSRINGLSNVFSSPVNFNNFGGNGTAMNLFYPWTTLYPAYLLLQLTGNLVTSYNLYYLLFTFATMAIAYVCMFKIRKSHFTALTFSIIFSFASYRSTDIFFRGSLGEAIALTFLPLIFLGCYYIFRSDFQKWYWLTLGMTLTVYTHLLSVLLNSLFIFIILIVSMYFMNNKKERFIALVKATMWTIVLSLGFFIPMIQQTSFVELKVPKAGVMNGLLISDYFSNTLNNNLSYFGIGLILFILAVYTYNRRMYLSKTDVFIYFTGIATVYASTRLFPWYLIQNTSLNVIQFTWRLTAYATLFLSYAGSISYTTNIKNNKNKLKKIILLSITVIMVHTVSLNLLLNQDGKTLYDKNKATSISQSYVHTDYANEDSLNYSEMLRNKEFIVDGETKLIDFSVTDSRFTFEYNNDKDKTNIIMPLYFYKGQVVEVNGEKVKSTLSEYGTTQFSTDKGDVHIEIFYEYTLLARLSQIISVVSFIIFTWYIIKKERFIISVK